MPLRPGAATRKVMPGIKQGVASFSRRVAGWGRVGYGHKGMWGSRLGCR